MKATFRLTHRVSFDVSTPRKYVLIRYDPPEPPVVHKRTDVLEVVYQIWARDRDKHPHAFWYLGNVGAQHATELTETRRTPHARLQDAALGVLAGWLIFLDTGERDAFVDTLSSLQTALMDVGGEPMAARLKALNNGQPDPNPGMMGRNEQIAWTLASMVTQLADHPEERETILSVTRTLVEELGGRP